MRIKALTPGPGLRRGHQTRDRKRVAVSAPRAAEAHASDERISEDIEGLATYVKALNMKHA